MKNSLLGFYLGCLFTFLLAEISRGMSATTNIYSGFVFDSMTGSVILGRLQNICILIVSFLFCVIAYYIFADKDVVIYKKLIYIVLLFLIGIIVLLSSSQISYLIFGQY